MTESDRRVPPADLYTEQLERKMGRRKVGQLGFLLTDAVKLVWRASPRDVSWVTVLQVGASLIAAVQVLISRRAISTLLDADRNGGDVAKALPAFALLALLAGLGTAGGAVQGQRQRLLGELVTRASWRRLLNVTVTVPLITYDSPSFFDHLQRVQSNALTQPLSVVTGLLAVLGGAVGSVGLIVALLVVQPLLVPVLLLAGLPLFILQRRGSRLEYAFALEQTQGMRARFALLEVLTGRPQAKEVRAFGVAHELRRRYEDLYETYLVALRKKVRRRLRLSLVSTTVTALISTAAVGFLLVLVQRHAVSLAAAAVTVAAIGLLARKLEQLVGGVGALLEAGLFLRDLDAFLRLAPTGHDAAGLLPDTTEIGAGFDELRVTGLGFTYPGSTTPALEGISFTLHRGEVLALVGENGSGKTTLSKVLAHLYRPTEGSVCWDDVDVVDLDPLRLRSATAVLFQDFVHYELSLKENLSLGRTAFDADQRRLEACVQAAGLGPVLERLDDGWETFLSSRFAGGTDLSGGQWQRVAMARALFRDSPFVVLDEPTAALDPKAEAALFEQLRNVFDGRTVVLVSHRFSSVRHADRIAVLEGGRLVELGSHAELMDAGRGYAEMFTLQARAFQ